MAWRNKPWLRYVSYLLLTALLLHGLVVLAASDEDALDIFVRLNPNDVFGTSEFSLVEVLQSVALVAAIVLCALTARISTAARPLGVLMSLMFLVMLIREQDFFIERWVPGASWLWPALITLAVAIYLAVSQREALARQVRGFMPTAAFGLMFAGMAIVIGFSRVLGQKMLWIALLDEETYRIVKLAAEELIELIGYCLVVAASVEYLTVASRERDSASP